MNNNILNSKKINIFNSTKLAHIKSCDITISIIIKTRIIQFKSIHTIKTCLILSKSKYLILIHYMISLSN